MLKNMLLFRLRDFEFSDSDIEKTISENAFVPCPAFLMQTSGWVEPYGEGTGFMKKAKGCMLLKFRTDKKTLPKPQINAMMDERVEAFTTTTGEEPDATEIDKFRDEILKELLPTIFPKSSVTTVVLNPKDKWMIVDAGSWKAGQDIAMAISNIFDTESPPLKIHTDSSPESMMTSWLLSGQINNDFRVGYDCTLIGDDKSKITVKNENLHSDEVLNHVKEAQKKVASLQLDWRGKLTFNVEKSMVLKGFAFGNHYPDVDDSTQTDDEVGYLDLFWATYAEELRSFVSDVLPHIAVSIDMDEEDEQDAA